MGNTSITVPVSQLEDPVTLPASPQSANAPVPGKAITAPVSQLQDAPNAAPAQPNAATPPTAPPSFLSRVATAAGSEISSLAAGAGNSIKSVMAPPQDAPEHIAYTTGGTPTLELYRASKAIVDGVQGLLQSKRGSFQQGVADLQNTVRDVQAKNYRNALADTGSVVEDIGSVTGMSPLATQGRGRDIAQGIKKGGDMVTPITKDVVDAGVGTALTAAPEIVPKGASAVSDSASDVATKLVKGEKVAQAPAQSALSQAAGAGSDVQGVRTFLDQPIADIAQTERAAYDTINKAAGTDLKSLYDHAEQVQDALDDPTNISNRSDLQKDLSQTRAQIEDGETKALSNGVSPDTLDQAISLTQKRYAGEEVARKLFNNESVVKGNVQFGANETVNIDSAIRNAENLNKPSRFAPRGTPPRLVQWFGKDGADNLLQNLYDAKTTGQSAVRARQILKWAAIGTVGVGSAGELLRKVL